jgi:hypothetical protein
MWNKDIRDAMKLQKQLKGLWPQVAQQERLRAQAEAAQKMMPSLEQMEAIRRQADWARRMAASVDPAMLRALRDVSTSREILSAVETARSALGERGFAAAQVLTDRELFFRPLPADPPKRDQEHSPAETPSVDRVRKVEELAGSDEVRELLERAVPETFEEEAAAYLQDEDVSDRLEADSDEVVLYGVDVKLSDAKKVALVLLVALHAAGLTPDLAAQIRQALDDLANVVGGLGWLMWGQHERGAAAEGSGVAGEDLLRFAGSIGADDLDAMERAIEEDCERVSPVER